MLSFFSVARPPDSKAASRVSSVSLVYELIIYFLAISRWFYPVFCCHINHLPAQELNLALLEDILKEMDQI